MRYYIALFNALIITCCILPACKHPADKKITKAFYYWKTNVSLTAYEQKKLDSFNCRNLYVRFFDIDWDAASNQPKPVAVSRGKQPLQQGFTYVPVVFVTQDALNKLPLTQVENLAHNLTSLLYQKCIQLKINPAEIQLDFDWTASNRNKYFHLLNLCKQQSFFKGKTLSCTIRLHQANAPASSGIPPTDRGLLMCYNMGNLKLAGNNNSILDIAVAEKYLNNIKAYPLPLDIALPLFNWCLLYDNENRFAGILRDIQESDLMNNSLFTRRAANIFAVNKDTIFKGLNLTASETIRYEGCSTENLYKLAGFIAPKINSQTFSLIFYHCDSAILSKYHNDELEKIYHLLH